MQTRFQELANTLIALPQERRADFIKSLDYKELTDAAGIVDPDSSDQVIASIKLHLQGTPIPDFYAKFILCIEIYFRGRKSHISIETSVTEERLRESLLRQLAISLKEIQPCKSAEEKFKEPLKVDSFSLDTLVKYIAKQPLMENYLAHGRLFELARKFQESDFKGTAKSYDKKSWF